MIQDRNTDYLQPWMLEREEEQVLFPSQNTSPPSAVQNGDSQSQLQNEQENHGHDHPDRRPAGG